jgi:hypothetical protein
VARLTALFALLSGLQAGCGAVRSQPVVGPPAQLALSPGLTLTAEVEPNESHPGWLRARVRIFNRAQNPVHLAIGDPKCEIVLRAYVRRSRSAARLVGSSEWGEERACAAMRFVDLDLAPGQTQTVEADYLLRRMMGGKPPAGEYSFTVAVRFIEPQLTTREIDAGVLQFPD